MAIQQISRITLRKGLEEDLPQPLAGAELGWAVDQRRLYIGNGTLAEGAPIVGNTEILTEFSDILSYSTAYTYQGQAAGYTVQTGVTSGSPVTQSLQARLDSYAVVKDFGATGDGVTDDTAAINRALFELYCRQTNTQVRRGLFFPAGEYIITDTLLIPPYARLYGEGSDSSILRFRVDAWAANTAYPQSGVLVENAGNYYRNRIAVPATGVAISDTTYWEAASLPAYVARTTDSLQQTGTAIGTNNAITPQKIEISGMAFQTDESVTGGGHDVFLVDRASSVKFQNVSWIGPLTINTINTAAEDIAGLRFASATALLCEHIVADTCCFTGLTYGINTATGTRGATVTNSFFDVLYQGCVLGSSVVTLGGPSGCRLVQNVFDNVYAEGVIINNCSLNGTAYNSFYQVGNSLSASPSTPVIRVNADNNVSIGDVFQRNDTDAQTQPRVYLFNTGATPQTVPTSIAFTNGRTVQLGSYTRQSGIQQTIEDGTTVNLLTINTALGAASGGPQSFAVDYTMIRDTTTGQAVRKGRITVISTDISDSSIPLPLTWNDDYMENSQVDMALSVSESSGNVTVTVSSSATGEDGRIYYSLSYLA